MAFTNIIDIIYPIGSMYFSNTSTSPATLFGGTWAQIKNALISSLGYGSNTLGNYGNSNTITVEQMPSHKHAATHFFAGDRGEWVSGNDNDPAACMNNNHYTNWKNYSRHTEDIVTSTGGATHSIRTIIARMFGCEPHKFQDCAVM